MKTLIKYNYEAKLLAVLNYLNTKTKDNYIAVASVAVLVAIWLVQM